MEQQQQHKVNLKKKVTAETFIALGGLVLLIGFLAGRLGLATLMRTIMNLSHDLLLNTCFFIMGIAVIMGALGEVLSEFGITDLFNLILSPLMKPLYGLPGAASLGILTTFLSDNPAILTLAQNANFRSKFHRYQIPALCNLGTAFGMGMIVITYMSSLAVDRIGFVILAGLLGAVVGSIVSTRIMLHKCKKYYGDTSEDAMLFTDDELVNLEEFRVVREGSGMGRLMNALLEGGKSGVEIGLSVIPGVLIICTLVFLLTNSPDDPFPGVPVIPKIGEWLSFILQPLFGFSSPEDISVPITALGSAGAAIGLIPSLVEKGLAKPNDLAVFTSMCMCWSGYLSTHIAMMDTLDARELSSSAILSHTIGGLCAGMSANLIFRLLCLF